MIAGQFAVAESGGLFTIASNGSISTTLLDGTSVTGNLNTATLSASGNFSVPVDGAVHSGTWSVTRQLPLPVPTTREDIVIDFGPGIGIFVRLNNASWFQLHTLSPDTMVTGDVDGS